MRIRDLLGLEVGMPAQGQITARKVRAAHEHSPRRVCFPTTHQTALKRDKSGRYIGSFSVPFFDTIGPLFEAATSLKLFKSKYEGYWRSIQDEAEFETISRWIADQGYRVFLKDTLALSIALAPNFDENNNRTKLGDLEYNAKWASSAEAANELSELTIAAVEALPFYRDAEVCTAVPPREGKEKDLPSAISAGLAEARGIDNVTSGLSWANPKPKVKELTYDERWEAGSVLIWNNSNESQMD
jgi:hypothetical protein